MPRTLPVNVICFQPIEKWNTTNVVEWMAVVNLYRYSELFKRHAITGKSLMTMTEHQLKVIAFNYSLENFIHCLEVVVRLDKKSIN